MSSFVAVDLGASSGRVTLGRVVDDIVRHTEVHRFANVPVRGRGGLRWDIHRLYGDVLDGLRKAGEQAADIMSVGVDSWAVDYALLDASGRLLDLPFHYREPRTAAAVARVHETVGADVLYDRTGLQHLPFTTIFQLAADRAAGRLAPARRLLMVSDLVGFWLTGVMATDRTMASTTGVLDVRSGEWAGDVLDELDLPRTLLPDLVEPGTVLGAVRTAVSRQTGLRPETVVTTVAGHDTASAVVAVPAPPHCRSAYISCGTWSLVGLELDRPVLSDASRRANFTNERGVDGTTRFLRNVMGLWPWQEAIKEWRADGAVAISDASVAAEAAACQRWPVFDVDDPALLAEGNMLARLKAMILRVGHAPPLTRGGLARCIVDSLAAAHARTLGEALELTGREVDVVHLVGGGARNPLLAQLTADRCGRSVTTGPVEAASMGNLLVQARAHGGLAGGLDQLRGAVRRSAELGTFEPECMA